MRTAARGGTDFPLFGPAEPAGGASLPIMSASDQRVSNEQRTEVIGVLTRALDTAVLPLDEYDRRVAAVSAASFVSQLRAQVDDLPEGQAWLPHAPATPVAPDGHARAYPRTALVLGLLSVPLALCLAGWIFGFLAVLYSRRGDGPPSRTALAGRVFGIVGILLSVAAGVALYAVAGHGTAP